VLYFGSEEVIYYILNLRLPLKEIYYFYSFRSGRVVTSRNRCEIFEIQCT
jgi:hypothetical protein